MEICILTVAEVEIASVKRPQRMVHPVVEVEAELQPLVFGDLEVLEQARIPIEICRSIDRR